MPVTGYLDDGIGRLIGAVGNGDLKIALIILSIYQTMGVVSLLLNALFGFRAWKILFRFVRLAILPHGAAGRLRWRDLQNFESLMPAGKAEGEFVEFIISMARP